MRRPHTASSGKRNRTRILKKGPGSPAYASFNASAARASKEVACAVVVSQGRRISRRARLKSVALPVEVTASRVETSAAVEAAAIAVAGSGAAELTPRGELLSDVALRARAACAGDPGSLTPTRANSARVGDPGSRACCGFGAVRVGPLLGRLRLHLQTERFLAVHRNDSLWQESCAAASLALAAIAESMDGAELDAPLRPELTPDFVLAREQSSRWRQGSFEVPFETPSKLGTSQGKQDESFEAQGKWGTLRDSGPARKTGTAALAACRAALEMGECEMVASVITSPPQAKTSVFAAEKKADEGSAVATKQARNRTADCPGADRHERARGAR